MKSIPICIIVLALLVCIIPLKTDLAAVEAFDAYLLKSAALLSILIAIIGLVVSAFVPMAYCHYGCPTGALLNFVRYHGKADKFGLRDLIATIILISCFLLIKFHTQITGVFYA